MGGLIWLDQSDGAGGQFGITWQFKVTLFRINFFLTRVGWEECIYPAAHHQGAITIPHVSTAIVHICLPTGHIRTESSAQSWSIRDSFPFPLTSYFTLLNSHEYLMCCCEGFKAPLLSSVRKQVSFFPPNLFINSLDWLLTPLSPPPSLSLRRVR